MKKSMAPAVRDVAATAAMVTPAIAPPERCFEEPVVDVPLVAVSFPQVVDVYSKG